MKEGRFPTPNRKAEWFSNPMVVPIAQNTANRPKAPKAANFSNLRGVSVSVRSESERIKS